MIWPPYLLDLNPIENLWALMKAEIYRAHPKLLDAPDTIATVPLLVQAAQEAWQAIKQKVYERLCETMDYRVAAIIAANGWYTKY